jgi:orotate phosphoribosyltransferase
MTDAAEDEALRMFRESGALLEGHFILRSGLRSREFFQCARVCEDLGRVERLAELLRKRLGGLDYATVVAPAMGGLVLGQEVARQSGARFLFAEKDAAGRLVLRRGFRLAAGERVLVVEDVVTRGGRAQETIDLVRAAGAVPVALAVLVNRGGGEPAFTIPFEALVSLQIPAYPPEELPGDLAAIPPVKPGS